MKKTVFEGSGVAIITPFTEDGVEYPKLGELIDFQIQQGTDCIVIAGTTGEASTMPDQEHIRTIQYTVERVAGRVPVLAGAGSNDTNHGDALCRAAQDVGADAVLLVTPYYHKPTQRGLYEHFAVMAKAIDIPIILYNVPSRTGMNMTPETVARLAKDFDNIVGIKECEFGHVGELKNLCGEDFSIYSGEDGLAVPLMSMGGKGVISVLANIVPADVHQMIKACLQGDWDTARRLQLKALPLIKALFCETSPIPVKEAMNMLGMNVGGCRLPLVEMEEANRAKLRQAMLDYGLQ